MTCFLSLILCTMFLHLHVSPDYFNLRDTLATGFKSIGPRIFHSRRAQMLWQIIFLSAAIRFMSIIFNLTAIIIPGKELKEMLSLRIRRCLPGLASNSLAYSPEVTTTFSTPIIIRFLLSIVSKNYSLGFAKSNTAGFCPGPNPYLNALSSKPSVSWRRMQD